MGKESFDLSVIHYLRQVLQSSKSFKKPKYNYIAVSIANLLLSLISHSRIPKTLTIKVRLSTKKKKKNGFTYPRFETETWGNLEMAYFRFLNLQIYITINHW